MTRRNRQLRGGRVMAICLPAWLMAAYSAFAASVTNLNGSITITNSGWAFVPNSQLYFIQATAAFDGGEFSGSVNSVSEPMLGSTSVSTPQITGPPPGMPFGQGAIDHSGTAGSLSISANYTLTSIGQTGVPPPTPRMTATQAFYSNSISSISGPMFSKTDMNVGIKAGTQVQGFGPAFRGLQFSGRFADHAISDPAALWDDSLLSGVIGLYQITISRIDSGTVGAAVNLQSSSLNPDFGLTFDSSDAQIQAAIAAANWVPDSNGIPTLSQDLSLLTITVTTLNPSRAGTPVTIGERSRADAFDTAIPEPSALGLVGISILGMLGYTRGSDRKPRPGHSRRSPL